MRSAWNAQRTTGGTGVTRVAGAQTTAAATQPGCPRPPRSTAPAHRAAPASSTTPTPLSAAPAAAAPPVCRIPHVRGAVCLQRPSPQIADSRRANPPRITRFPAPRCPSLRPRSVRRIQTCAKPVHSAGTRARHLRTPALRLAALLLGRRCLRARHRVQQRVEPSLTLQSPLGCHPLQPFTNLSVQLSPVSAPCPLRSPPRVERLLLGCACAACHLSVFT